MATFKLILSPYEKSNKTHSIDLRVTINRKSKPIPTKFYVKVKEWDAAKERVKAANPNFTQINDALQRKVEDAEKKYAVLAKKSAPTLQQLVDAIRTPTDFYLVAKAKIEEHRKNGQIGHSDKIESHMGIIKVKYPSLSMENITPDFIRDLKTHLKTTTNKKGKKYTRNSITSILSSCRAVYNSTGVKVSDIDPFATVKIGSYVKAGGVPLEENEIEKLWNYIPSGKWNTIAQKCFLFSYYALGMRPGDVLTLLWDEVGKDYIVKTYNKTEDTTGVMLHIPINDRLRKLLNSFDRKHKTVFGVITATKDEPEELDRQMAVALTEITKQLKLIAQKCGITKNIKAKLARTTFGHIANKKTGRNVYGIQQSMGHSKIATTEIYLGDDQTAIDEVAKQVYG